MVGWATSIRNISVRNWIFADSGWLVCPLALCSLNPTDTWMWKDLPGRLVVGNGASAERLDIREANGGPHRRLRIIKFLARADDLGLGEACDEDRDEALPDLVGAAEVGESREEIFAVIEGYGEATA